MHALKNSDFYCNCLVCEGEREKKVNVGCLVIPASLDPKGWSPGTVPFWYKGEWQHTGFNNRFYLKNEQPMLVLRELQKSDASNGGHLNVVELYSFRLKKNIVTAKRWLVVVDDLK